MAEFEFDLVFALPEGEFDAFELSDAIFAAGFPDAVIGTGRAGAVAVSLEHEGADAESAILDAARAILANLPKGSALREARPDLVSMADVAKRLNIKRQALQQRAMPMPAVKEFYRVTEVWTCLEEQQRRATRRARFELDPAGRWFAAGQGAQLVNALMALGMLDPWTLERKKRDAAEARAH